MRKVICFLFLSVIYFGAAAQAPDSLSFQAVIRDADGNLLTDQTVSARVGIYQGAEDGTKVFEETHTATTNSNGLLTLLIGGGTNVTGDLSTMDWGAGPYFIKREIDPNGGTDYVISGTSQFLSVPYALYAASGGSADNMGNHTASQDLDMNGNAITDLAGSTGQANPLKIAVRRDSQDIYIQSYDEIYITTFDSIGVKNDPDGNAYSTAGDIELTSGDDLIIKTLGDDIDIVSADDIDIDADTDIELFAEDDIEIIAPGDNITINTKNTSTGDDQDVDLIADDDINLTADDGIVMESLSGNFTIQSGNDIELIFSDSPADDDYVEIWKGRDTFLYALPKTSGQMGQILVRQNDASGATDEKWTTWTPYKFPLADGNSGQVLQTDGSGNVTWATSGGASKLDDLSDVVFSGAEYSFNGSLWTSLIIGSAGSNNANAAYANVGVGPGNMTQLTTGINNTIVGWNSFNELTTGQGNTIIGYDAGNGASGSNNGNILLGTQVGIKLNGNNNIIIGNQAGSTNTPIFGSHSHSSKLLIGDNKKPVITGDIGDMGSNSLSSNQTVQLYGTVTFRAAGTTTPIITFPTSQPTTRSILVVNTDGSSEWQAEAAPTAQLSGDAPQTLSNYEELDVKTRELNNLLKESMSKIEELEKRLNEQQELINRQFELIKKLEEKK